MSVAPPVHTRQLPTLASPPKSVPDVVAITSPTPSPVTSATWSPGVPPAMPKLSPAMAIGESRVARGRGVPVMVAPPAQT